MCFWLFREDKVFEDFQKMFRLYQLNYVKGKEKLWEQINGVIRL
jgi:hypothetical protein